MKTIIPALRWISALAAAALLTGSVFAALSNSATTQSPANLQLVVDVPPSARPLIEEDAADALSGVIQENLTRRGYKGTISYPGDGNSVPTLVVKLVEWRTDPLGSIKCTITASVHTAGGTQDLGLFTGTSLGSWNGGQSTLGANIANRSDAMKEAANDAIKDLTRALAKNGSLPGFADLKK